MADILGPAAAHGRLLLHSFNDAEQRFVSTLGVDGSVPTGGDDDVLTLGMQDTLANKIDAFITRSVDDSVVYDPSTGTVDATVRISVRNDAPASGLPRIMIGNDAGLPDGTARPQLLVGSALSLEGATIDGVATRAAGSNEYGRVTYRVTLEVKPQSTRIVELHLRGAIKPSEIYRLTVQAPGAATEQTFHLSVSGVQGWEVVGVPTGAIQGEQARVDRTLPFRSQDRVGFRRST